MNISSKCHIQLKCISKSKLNVFIHKIIISIFSHRNLINSLIFSINDSNSLRVLSSIEEISHINIIFLNILITHFEDYKTDLDTIKIIIHDNQIEIYQINLDIFNQLMK